MLTRLEVGSDLYIDFTVKKGRVKLDWVCFVLYGVGAFGELMRTVTHTGIKCTPFVVRGVVGGGAVSSEGRKEPRLLLPRGGSHEGEPPPSLYWGLAGHRVSCVVFCIALWTTPCTMICYPCSRGLQCRLHHTLELQ